MPQRSSKRMTAFQRREQLIKIGRTVFAEHGFEAATMEELARRARVSKPIVYEHFGGKKGLYSAIVDRELEAILDRVSASIRHGSPRERFERAALAFLSYVEERPDGFGVLSRDAPLTVASGGLLSVLTELADRVAEIFALEFQKAGYDPGTAPIYSHALVGMVTFVGQWWTGVRRPPVREVAAHIAALGWMGLRHLPRRPILAAGGEGEKERTGPS